MEYDGLVKLGNVYGDYSGMSYAGNVWDKNYYSPVLKTMQGGGNQPMIVEDKKDYVMHGNNSNQMQQHSKYAIRKLIPLECNRLMGFPDWVHKKQKEAGISDSQQWLIKCLGMTGRLT